MSAYENGAVTKQRGDDNNVLPFRRRSKVAQHRFATFAPTIAMDNLAVDIRGNISLGRLLSGLSTVGLTVRMDTRSGKVIITDELINVAE